MFTTPDQILPQTLQVVRDGMAAMLHMGMQLYISQHGDVIADFAIGQNAPSQTLLPQMLCAWMSAGKPLTAAAIMQAVDRAALQLDDPVYKHLPEFGTTHKKQITIRHLLTHTAGLRPVASGWHRRPWDEIIQKICSDRLRKDWIVGEHAAYDPSRSWFLLGEILRRLDGRPVQQIVREDLLEPLKMPDCWMAVPRHLHLAYGDRIGILYNVQDNNFHPTKGHDLEVCQAPSPGGSLRGPASQLGRFYEMLLRGGTTVEGKRILSPESVKAMTSRQREGLFDLTFQHKLDFGLGMIINSNRYGAETVPYGFGRHASEFAFGHGGAQSSIAFADPEHALVVVAIANGCPGEELHNRRFRELNSAIYKDLELTSSVEED